MREVARGAIVFSTLRYAPRGARHRESPRRWTTYSTGASLLPKHRRANRVAGRGPRITQAHGDRRNAKVNVGAFSQGQRQYLEFHRENVLRMARGVSKDER